MPDNPIISVVTPFRNTKEFLSECIESVLAQTYPHFEYILSDNCSTDGAGELADSYALRDKRVRVIHWEHPLTQVQHYNSALAEISPESKYCKIVQADDFIFPDCLRLMVRSFEQSETIGLVSGYDLKGDVVRGSKVPFQSSPFSGATIARLCLLKGVFPFGSPTTVMYRSALVRASNPFFDESLLHEDTEKCMQILKEWNFGFVYQVLSYLRTGNESITGSTRDFNPDSLDRYIIVSHYAFQFLDREEASKLCRRTKKAYYQVLAHAILQRREKAFWRYHTDGLKMANERIDRLYLGAMVIRELADIICNPGRTVEQAFNRLKRSNVA